MVHARRFGVAAVYGWPFLLASCDAPGPTAAEYGARYVRRQDRASVLDAAEAALLNAGLQIERRDTAAGVVTTLPMESRADDQPGGSVGLSSRGRTRRLAEVRLEESGDAIKVYCKVMIQEQATQAYSMFNQERTGADSPGEYTAINRDAATTQQQNTVWRTLRRDKAMERSILDAILDATGGEPPAARR